MAAAEEVVRGVHAGAWADAADWRRAQAEAVERALVSGIKDEVRRLEMKEEAVRATIVRMERIARAHHQHERVTVAQPPTHGPVVPHARHQHEVMRRSTDATTA